MLQGRPKKIDWRQYKCRNFKFMPQVTWGECGGFALHILTGEPYEEIAMLSKKGHWSNQTMFGFLKHHGCEIIPITMGNMVFAHSVSRSKPELGPMHVILINHWIYKEEGSWSVIHNNQWAHSGDVEPVDPLKLLNWPIAEAYLIYNKEWK